MLLEVFHCINLKLVPKFNEHDPDVFFSLFERVAEMQGWSKTNCVLLLQCVLVGKAQLAFSALTIDECKDYDTVKAAVLKVYECVPETYRQRFRSCKMITGRTHLEFVRELRRQATRWCSSLDVKTFDDLLELIIIEQFKNSVPEQVATYVNEHKFQSPEEAASLADNYVLTHKSTAAVWQTREEAGLAHFTNNTSQSGHTFSRKFDQSKTCNYCRGKGHWKADCLILKSKNKRVETGKFKPAAMANSVHLCDSDTDIKLSNNCLSSFSPFITEGRVSLLDGSMEVPIKILRDTGAVDSFIFESTLPFSSQSETGESILVRGMGLNTLSVLLDIM